MTDYQPIFDQGHNAYHDGVTTNPHSADTVEHGYWWEGWRVAEFFEKARAFHANRQIELQEQADE